MSNSDTPAWVGLSEGLGAAFSAWKAARKAAKARRERRAIAKVFNDLYCYREQYEQNAPRLTGTAMCGLLPPGGNRWMCQECNRIHAPVECSVWSGLQYPRCCSTGGGNRLAHGIRTSA